MIRMYYTMVRQSTANKNDGPKVFANIIGLKGSKESVSVQIWNSEAAVQTRNRVGNTKANWFKSCVGTKEKPPQYSPNCHKGGRFGLITPEGELMRAGDSSINELEDAGFTIEWL